MCNPVQPRPSGRAFLTNLSGPRPWPEKVRLLLRNNWLKLVRMKSCCGHLGEPGC